MTYTMPRCQDCGPGYRIGDEGCKHPFRPANVIRDAYVKRVTTSYDWEGFLDRLASDLLKGSLHNSHDVDKAQIEALSTLQRELMMGRPGEAIVATRIFLDRVNDSIMNPRKRWEFREEWCEWVGCDTYLGTSNSDNLCEVHQ